ncbi:MAG: hypothetical protein EXR93_09200 [Gemmatimonadetes bacterium]|nr:hypothetical protein [Gemmatimonadota bacterium]
MLSELWAAYAAAFALGTAHALEVDHMVALGAFVGGNPRLRSALGFGVRWGIGHAAVVLVAGGLLAASGLRVPESAQTWLEAGVGLALIGVGVWAWFNARRLHLHGPEEHGSHGHLHTHGTSPAHHHHDHVHAPETRHAHLSTLVGAVHGLAGSAPVVALVPVTLMPSLGAALGYLLAFGIGTILGMGAYAGAAALAVGRAAESVRLARGLAFGTAFLSMAVGVWWLVRLTSSS